MNSPEALRDYGVRFSFPLLDLAQIPDERLGKDPFLQSVLQLLKYGRRPNLGEYLDRIFRLLFEGTEPGFRDERVRTVLFYILATNRTIPVKELRMNVEKFVFPTQIEPGSIADQLLQEGRAEGRDEAQKESEIRFIHILQDLLSEPLTDVSVLEAKTFVQLRDITTELQDQLRRRRS